MLRIHHALARATISAIVAALIPMSTASPGVSSVVVAGSSAPLPSRTRALETAKTSSRRVPTALASRCGASSYVKADCPDCEECYAGEYTWWFGYWNVSIWNDNYFNSAVELNDCIEYANQHELDPEDYCDWAFENLAYCQSQIEYWENFTYWAFVFMVVYCGWSWDRP